jgi:hypothetical protein
MTPQELMALSAKATPGEYRRDIAQIDKDWLKGRLQEAVIAGDDVIAACAESDTDATFISAACNYVRNELPALVERVRELECERLR